MIPIRKRGIMSNTRDKYTRGDALRLEKAFPYRDQTAKRAWVCWACEESTDADGENSRKRWIESFVDDHWTCTLEPYSQEPLS